MYSPFIQPGKGAGDRPAAPTIEEKNRFRQETLNRNCAFDKAERLQGNIGYLKLDAFEDPDVCGPTVAAAFDFIANTDSLIFDLRENHGGDPSMVQLIVSYLFANQTHINDMLYQHEGTIRQYWTLPSVAGARYLDKPGTS